MDQILQILVAGAGSFVGITIICMLIFLISQCKSALRNRNRSLRLGGPTSSSLEAGHSSAWLDVSLDHVSMSELKSATDDFNPKLIIGDGSFGLVYKALLSNGLTVAVKKLSPDAFQGIREFRAEMDTLSKLHHKNIVKILGYSSSGRDRILIYEFIEKGSLDQWLQGPSLEVEDSNYKAPLSWDVRVRIVKGVANGLNFMHGLETPIVHRDIKASNVLLDSDFEAHIADFGLARRIEGSHSHVSTQSAGTMGYMPPEYRAGYTAATVKADVYSFGVLMFEVATGKRPNWPVLNDEGREIWMLEWAKDRISKDRHLEVIDPSISREQLNESEVVQFLTIADLCTSENKNDRPSMPEVVQMLSQLQSIAH